MPEAVLENQYADELRQQKMAQKEAKLPSGSLASGSLRERVMAARNALNVKEKAKQAIQKKVVAPVSKGTSQLLRSAWQIMFSVIGFLPGLAYVNIHVFLKAVLGEKLFCKLGEEWIPKQAATAGGEAAKTAGKGVGIVEVMVLLFLDLVVLLIILVQVSFIVLMLNIIQNPLDYIGVALGAVWHATTGFFIGK